MNTSYPVNSQNMSNSILIIDKNSQLHIVRSGQ